ncbi:methyltransferase domain-containing protein [Sanguibacter antarcticus]|uniref:Methyltransferase family protein n=1 Tax=Sanguibacter antarcticus TaxID=372484 RepID=A0A2A9E7S3_9MICO|nr:methyltransferase domain-containing protein [Sanguibacter antarcticus]PFG34282.1 methyltransferase family protein [Sanguibacter antarcticus]
MSVGVGFASVFTDALRGEACTIVGMAPEPQIMPVHRWVSTADASDRAVLAHCTGATIDLGCGPGRMAEHLVGRGVVVLGVDLVPEAVEQTRARGVRALQADMFGPLPGEGRWSTALLADGNVGVGGDPLRLLRRVRGLIAVGGRIVVDLAPPGTGLQVHTVRLRTGDRQSRPFPWAVLGVDALASVAASAGLEVDAVHDHDGRWVALLSRGPEEPACLA